MPGQSVRWGLPLAVSAALFTTGCQFFGDAGEGETDIAAMETDELVEHIVFESDSYRLDQPVQEGGSARGRMEQDDLQRACSVVGGELPDDQVQEVIALARESYEAPTGGPRLGDWERGAELARSGYGFRVGHRNDDHSTRTPGGNCYACHQMDPNEPIYGTIGPSLAGYGSGRGTDEASLRYAHEVISNPHQYFPCTEMPRFGANELLSEREISHIMAYLLDPESPVNQ